MKHLKKWILFLSIAIIVIIVIIVLIRSKKVGTDYSEDASEFEQDTSHIKLNKEIKKVENRNNFYAVKNIIGKYAYSIIEGGKESLYKIMNPNYLSENKITKENILEEAEDITKDNLTEDQMDYLNINVEIENMYYVDTNVNIATYFAYGQFKYNINSDRIPFSIIVEIDSTHNTYYLYPTKYVKNQYPEIEDLTNYSTQMEEIPNNNYNKFNFTNISDTVIINDYLANYKDKLSYDVDSTYEMIDSQYREQKFPEKEEYLSYVNENIKKLLSISIDKYKVDHRQDDTQYTIVDPKGNYYIFIETAIMEYTILLDPYTIDLPEFVEKYEKAEEDKKVGMNTEKILQALNAKDYSYIYNKLDEEFKNNNFNTFDRFKEYMENKYKDNYNIAYAEAKKEKDVYIQPFTLTPKEQENAEEINNSIIMQLKENTDFVISFNVEE